MTIDRPDDPTSRGLALLGRFDDFCRRVTQLAEGLRPMLAHAGQPSPLAFGAVRQALLGELTALQRFKQGDVFDPLIRAGTPAQARRARELKAECIEHGEAFRAYATSWTTIGSIADWDRYRGEAAAAIALMGLALAQQRVDLVQLLVPAAVPEQARAA